MKDEIIKQKFQIGDTVKITNSAIITNGQIGEVVKQFPSGEVYRVKIDGSEYSILTKFLEPITKFEVGDVVRIITKSSEYFDNIGVVVDLLNFSCLNDKPYLRVEFNDNKQYNYYYSDLVKEKSVKEKVEEIFQQQQNKLNEGEMKVKIIEKSKDSAGSWINTHIGEVFDVKPEREFFIVTKGCYAGYSMYNYCCEIVDEKWIPKQGEMIEVRSTNKMWYTRKFFSMDGEKFVCKDINYDFRYEGWKEARPIKEITRIKISDIHSNQDFRDKINKLSLDEIEFVDDNGDIIKIDKSIIDDFKFTGLNNIDFILTDFYKEGWTE